MKRYRKGQTFRPPTAAESAANADALEGFRSRTQEPQARVGRADKLIVKTPVDGIPARDATVISSAICAKVVETSNSNERTILDTDEDVEVFNLETTPVEGEIYVQTGLTLHGTRCVEAAGGSSSVIPVELKTDLAAFGGSTVHILDSDGLRTGDERTARDILGFYEGVGSAGTGVDDEGDKGWCVEMPDGKLKFIALSCDPPGTETETVEPPPPSPGPGPEPDPIPEPDPDPYPYPEPFGTTQLL